MTDITIYSMKHNLVLKVVEVLQIFEIVICGGSMSRKLMVPENSIFH
jgi:hypothetical protein